MPGPGKEPGADLTPSRRYTVEHRARNSQKTRGASEGDLGFDGGFHTQERRLDPREQQLSGRPKEKPPPFRPPHTPTDLSLSSRDPPQFPTANRNVGSGSTLTPHDGSLGPGDYGERKK